MYIIALIPNKASPCVFFAEVTVQKRNSLDYLPWATTWKLLKQHYPYSTYRVRKAADGRNYHHDDRTAWVEVELTLVEENNDGTFRENSITEMLAIMDYAKRSIPLDKLNSTDVVNTIQRCLTKACARMGLGIAIDGAMDFDDLPEEKQPLPDNVVDLTEIRERLDVGIKNYTKEMSKEQKVHLGVLFGIFCKMIHPACGRRKRTHAARSVWAAAQNDDFLCISPSCHPEQREALAKDLLRFPRAENRGRSFLIAARSSG